MSKDSYFGQFPSPRELSSLGMNGCTLYVRDDVAVPLLAISGPASWQIAIPANASAMGTDFYLQGLVIDPLGNPFGLTTSNAIAARTGAK